MFVFTCVCLSMHVSLWVSLFFVTTGGSVDIDVSGYESVLCVFVRVRVCICAIQGVVQEAQLTMMCVHAARCRS